MIQKTTIHQKVTLDGWRPIVLSVRLGAQEYVVADDDGANSRSLPSGPAVWSDPVRIAPRVTWGALVAFRGTFKPRGVLLLAKTRWRSLLLAPHRDHERARALRDGSYL